MHSFRALFLGLLLSLFIAAFAFADVEIVVTASRVEEDARSTPAYVRVIPEEDVARGDTVLDALRTVPDVAVKESSPGKEYVSMGGFGENGFARTLILIDGRPVNRPDMASVNWRTIPLDRIERIEIVKGAVSSQYGDQAVAGAINIVTKDPDGWDFWARTTLGINLTNRQAAGAAWGNERFRAEVGVGREDLRPSRDRSDSDTVFANLKLGITSGAFDIDAGGEYAIAVYELPGSLSEAEYLADPDHANNGEDEVEEAVYAANLDLKAEFGNYHAAIPVSWRRTIRLQDMVSYSAFTDVVLDDFRGTFQLDTKLFLGGNTVMIPIVGADFSWANIRVDQYGEIERTTRTSTENARRLDGSLWARGKAYLGERLTADAGMRFSVNEIACGTDEALYLPFVADAGVSWLPSDAWTAGLRYGRVYHYPLLDEQASYYGFGSPGVNEDLEPEFGHHLTLSVEYREGPFSLAVSPYFMSMKGEIAYNPVSWLNENIGDTYHFGGVVSGAWEQGIVGIKASYSLDRAQFQDSGDIVPLVPLHTAYARIALRPVSDLEISTDGRMTSEYVMGGDFTNDRDAVDGHFVWGARVDWSPIESLSVFIKAENLLDDRTPTMVVWNGFSEGWYPSEGRTVEVGGTWRY